MRTRQRLVVAFAGSGVYEGTMNIPDTNPQETEIKSIKQRRVDIDAQIQSVKLLPPSRECSLAITKLQEAVMWLGMELKRRNEPNPYPNSKDPSNATIDPTAQGLKL